MKLSNFIGWIYYLRVQMDKLIVHRQYFKAGSSPAAKRGMDVQINMSRGKMLRCFLLLLSKTDERHSTGSFHCVKSWEMRKALSLYCQQLQKTTFYWLQFPMRLFLNPQQAEITKTITFQDVRGASIKRSLSENQHWSFLNILKMCLCSVVKQEVVFLVLPFFDSLLSRVSRMKRWHRTFLHTGQGQGNSASSSDELTYRSEPKKGSLQPIFKRGA